MDDDRWSPRCPPATGVVRPVRLDPNGVTGPTRHQARRGKWRQSTYGFHVPADTDSTLVEQRILEQSMRVGDKGAVTGWAALRLWGAAFFDGLAADGRTIVPVPLVARTRIADRSGSVVSRVPLDGHKVWLVQGVRCVGPERAVVDEVLRCVDPREAVVVIDMACAARTTSLSRIRSYVERFKSRGSQRVLAALALSDERSMSPPETRMRLVWMLDADWPAPLCNPVLFSITGQRLGKPDLLDVATGVLGEYDGALHRTRTRHRIDVDRAERFRQHGLEPFVVVAGDAPAVQVERMAAARERALARDPADRRWSLTLPSGHGVAEMSIDQELDLLGRETD